MFRQSVYNNLKLLLTVPVMHGARRSRSRSSSTSGIRGLRQYRAIVFLPYVLPATAIGLTFSFLLQQNGVLNTALRKALSARSRSTGSATRTSRSSRSAAW